MIIKLWRKKKENHDDDDEDDGDDGVFILGKEEKQAWPVHHFTFYLS